MREAMTDRVADWRLLGLGFWQAWQIVAMCTDIVAPTSGKLFDQGNALLILLVLMTAAYLAVVVASRRYAPFAGRGSSYVSRRRLWRPVRSPCLLPCIFWRESSALVCS